MVEGWLDDEDRRPRRGARASPPRDTGAAAAAETRAPRTVCARCHSLTHNGCVRSPCVDTLGASLWLVVCTCLIHKRSFGWASLPSVHRTFTARMALLCLVPIWSLSKRQQRLFPPQQSACAA